MPLLEVFSCTKCGCKRFWRRKTIEQMVDWSREGTIPGHPYLEGAPLPFLPVQFICAECENPVDQDTAFKMEFQVI